MSVLVNFSRMSGHYSGRHGRSARAGVDEVQVHHADFLQLLGQVSVGFVGFGVGGHVVEHAPGREADAGALGPNGLGHRAGYFKHKAGAVLHAAAVLVGALVAGGVQELLQQVAVGAVQLHAIKTGFEGQLGAVHILVAHAGQLIGAQGAGRGLVLHLLLVGPHLAFGGHGRGGNAFGTFGQVEGVENAASVHQLNENVAAVVVHRFGDALPVGDVLRALNRPGMRA